MTQQAADDTPFIQDEVQGDTTLFSANVIFFFLAYILSYTVVSLML